MGRSTEVDSVIVLAHANSEGISFKDPGSNKYKPEQFTLDDFSRVDNSRPIGGFILLGCDMGAGVRVFTNPDDTKEYRKVNNNLAQQILIEFNTNTVVASDGWVHHAKDINNDLYTFYSDSDNRNNEKGFKLYKKNEAGKIYSISVIAPPKVRLTISGLLQLVGFKK